MLRSFIVFLGLFAIASAAYAQQDKDTLINILPPDSLNIHIQDDTSGAGESKPFIFYKKSEIYNLSPWIDIPITVVGAATNYWGLQVLKKKTRLSKEELAALNAGNINKFDRGATHQDPIFAEKAHLISDYIMNGTFILPALLSLDKDMRHEWLTNITLYLEAMSIGANFYSWGAGHIKRVRPYVYNPDEDDKGHINATNSFFSGHTSSTATATFFMAKSFSDYHPELGNKKYWLYAAAMLPPAAVGILRYKAAKHFPTDIIAGFPLGAAVGVLVPHFHKKKELRGKNKKKQVDFSLIPVTGPVDGFWMTLKF